jgi:hypothetical protein
MEQWHADLLDLMYGNKSRSVIQFPGGAWIDRRADGSKHQARAKASSIVAFGASRYSTYRMQGPAFLA